MKKLFTIFAAALFGFTANAQNTDLMISGYFEGTKGQNKVIVLYNGTGADIDLSAYSFKTGTNGKPFGDAISLTGTIKAGETYMIAHSSADAAFLAVADMKEADNYPEPMLCNFNGDDAIGLFKGNTQIETMGVVGNTDKWGIDVVLIRKSTVTSPNTSYDAAEWDSKPATEDYAGWATILKAGPSSGTDDIAPTIAAVLSTSETSVKVTFSEDVTSETANVATNYTIDNSITVSAATVIDARNVNLTTSALTAGTTYTLTVNGVKDAAGNAMANVTKTFTTAIVVADLNALNNAFGDELNDLGASRPGMDAIYEGTKIYRITGPVAVTALGSQRNQKWIQDTSATSEMQVGAFMIDDPTKKITSTLAVGNTFSGLTGTITWYYGLLEFVPTADVVVDASPALKIEPKEVTLEDFKVFTSGTDPMLYFDVSRLVTLKGVYFKDNGELKNGTNYAMCNTSGGEVIDSALRTHIYGITYTANNTKSVDITGILVFNKGKIHIAPRTNADIVTETAANETLKVAADLVLSPVPAKDVLTVSMPGAVSVSIYNNMGVIVAEKQGIKNSTTINVANLAKGIYFVRVANGKGVIVTKKFVKG